LELLQLQPTGCIFRRIPQQPVPHSIGNRALGRLTIDNAPAEQAIRPFAVGRRNWLQNAGDRGLRSAAVLLSIAASAKRHGVNPWLYVRNLLAESAARKPDADYSDVLPDAWAQAGANPFPAPNRSDDPHLRPTGPWILPCGAASIHSTT
jgi:hypothetical protein